jgi:hypothetical protein
LLWLEHIAAWKFPAAACEKSQSEQFRIAVTVVPEQNRDVCNEPFEVPSLGGVKLGCGRCKNRDGQWPIEVLTGERRSQTSVSFDGERDPLIETYLGAMPVAEMQPVVALLRLKCRIRGFQGMYLQAPSYHFQTFPVVNAVHSHALCSSGGLHFGMGPCTTLS